MMMFDHTSHIGILTLSLHIPAAQSLKDKRRIVKSMKEQIRVRHNVSVSELDTLDKWQISVLGIAMIGNDRRYIDGCLQNILSFLETFDGVMISDQQIEFL